MEHLRPCTGLETCPEIILVSNLEMHLWGSIYNDYKTARTRVCIDITELLSMQSLPIVLVRSGYTESNLLSLTGQTWYAYGYQLGPCVQVITHSSKAPWRHRVFTQLHEYGEPVTRAGSRLSLASPLSVSANLSSVEDMSTLSRDPREC